MQSTEVRVGVALDEECRHTTGAPRRFTASNGVIHVRTQCLECGAQVGVFRKADLKHAIDHIPAWDEELRANYCQRRAEVRRSLYERNREQQSIEWWAQYDAYLNSSEWWRKRELVLVRDSYQCRAIASEDCGGGASQVHHLSYAHLGREPLWELMSVCVPCHEAITAMDRERRGS